MLFSLNCVPDILILSETWLTLTNKEFASLPGYKSYHTIRTFSRSGGISVFYRNHVSATADELLTISSKVMETLFESKV